MFTLHKSYLLVFALLLLSSLSFADVLTPGVHTRSFCTVISNADQFDDVVFIGVTSFKAYLIRSGECLMIHPKLDVYWAVNDSSAYTQSMRIINESKYYNSSQIEDLNLHHIGYLYSSSYQTFDSMPVFSITKSYSIKKVSDNRYELVHENVLLENIALALSFILNIAIWCIVTILIELCVCFVLIRKIFKISKSDLPDSSIMRVCALTSVITFPLLWLSIFFHLYILVWLFLSFIFGGFIASITVFPTLELLIVGAEALIYVFMLKLSFKRAFIISLFCNLASLVVGYALMLILSSPYHF
jgi:hypothetical protein